MTKILSLWFLLAGLALLAGCHSGASVTGRVAMGETYADAERVLKGRGAVETSAGLDRVVPTTLLEHVWETGPNELLVIDVNRSNGVIEQMELCSNIDLPKAQRDWKTVTTYP